MKLFQHLGMIVATYCALTTFDLAHAGDAEHVPSFIAMRGDWISVGVRADPDGVFDQMPELAQPHLINAVAAPIHPGVLFTVEQIIDGKPRQSALTYYYDKMAGKSFGLIASGGRPPIRGVITHHDDFDALELFNKDGEVIACHSLLYSDH